MKWICLIVAAGILIAQPLSAQSLYDRALGARGYGNLSINDQGSAFRGGANFSPFHQGPTSRELFRGRASTGGVCDFDLLAGFVEKFKDLPEQIIALAGPLALGFGLQILCETAPSYCDIVKQIYQAANFSLRSQFGRCQDLVLTGMSLATASQRDALKACVQRKQQSGFSVDQAMQSCPREINAPRGINGIEAPEFSVVETVLESTGVDAETIGQITGMVGDVNLSAQGSIFTQDGTKSTESIFVTYETELEAASEAVTEAVNALSGGTLPEQSVLDRLGGPGYPASADALLEIAREPDPELRRYEIQRYAGNITYSKMVWTIHELADVLQAAIETSSLTPEIRQQLTAKQNALRRQVDRIKDMRAAAEYQENHVRELLMRKGRRDAEVAAVANRGALTQLGDRYPNGQSSMGYTR